MRYLLWIMAVLLVGFSAPAVTNYVVPPGTTGVNPISAYTNWSTAATNIHDAFAASVNGNSIFITNGIYLLTNEIVVSSKVLTIRSYHDGYTDWTNTIIDGNNYMGKPGPITNRCFVLNSNSSNLLDGFTITGGRVRSNEYGGGVSMSGAHTVRNCRVTGNIAMYGGGIYAIGGLITNCSIVGNSVTNNQSGCGVYLYGGEMRNCVLSNNYGRTSASSGGGVFMRGDPLSSSAGGVAILRDCTISSNYAENGGGIRAWNREESVLVTNCVIINNRANSSGGGVWMESTDNGGYGTNTGPFNLMQDCMISNNSAGTSGGGVTCGYGTNVVVRNCLIVSNAPEGIFFNRASAASLQSYLVENCTIASNSVCGVKNASAAATNMVLNSIVYFNGTGGTSNWGGQYQNWSNSCTLPAPVGGVNCTALDPQFVDQGRNWRLSKVSPGIDRGFNQAWMLTGAMDLDHQHRRLINATVDMGAYEFLPGGTMFKFH